MNATIAGNAPRSPEQGERASAEGVPGIASKRRRIPWRLQTPLFVSPVPNGSNLSSYERGKGRRVFIVGKPALGSDVARETTDARRVYTDGHYPMVVTADGTSVSYAESWFGAGDYTPADATAVWEWLERNLRAVWRDNGASLLMTPATTGRDLWARTIPASVTWPVLSADAQTMIRSTAGQGRMEVVNPGRRRKLTRLYAYDARMAYVSMLDGLPVGEPRHLVGRAADEWSTSNPYGEARYLVTFRAPDGWNRPGVLPARVEHSGRDWVWPMAGEGWCGAADLFVARRAGWDATVLAGLVWERRYDPLSTWRDRLLRVLALADELSAVRTRMVRAAVRGMILHTIGSFHGAPHRVSQYGEAPPAEARKVRGIGRGRFAWEVKAPAAWPEMIHPEWSATVWSRARARLVSGHRGATGMLAVGRPDDLVAFRTDAIFTTSPQGWESADDGRPGRYRVETFHFDTTQPWPTDGPSLLRMIGK